MIKFTCEHCNRSLEVSDELAGRRIKCRFCEKATNVPEKPDSGVAAALPKAVRVLRKNNRNHQENLWQGVLLWVIAGCLVIQTALAIEGRIKMFRAERQAEEFMEKFKGGFPGQPPR